SRNSLRRRRLSVDPLSAVPAGRSDAWLVERLRDDARSNGLAVREVRASVEPVELRRRFGRADRDRPRLQRLLLSLQLADGRWVNGRALTPRPNIWLALRPALATLLTYLIILGAMLFLAARIARPLRDLTAAARRFQGRGEAPWVEPRGPADVRGAIGHDLRTPLASLRIRAESVEPADEREHMIATIEEMTAMLDDTLALARSGRAVEQLRSVDLVALADALVEEFRSLGGQVEMV